SAPESPAPASSATCSACEPGRPRPAAFTPPGSLWPCWQGSWEGFGPEEPSGRQQERAREAWGCPRSCAPCSTAGRCRFLRCASCAALVAALGVVVAGVVKQLVRRHGAEQAEQLLGALLSSGSTAVTGQPACFSRRNLSGWAARRVYRKG